MHVSRPGPIVKDSGGEKSKKKKKEKTHLVRPLEGRLLDAQHKQAADGGEVEEPAADGVEVDEAREPLPKSRKSATSAFCRRIAAVGVRRRACRRPKRAGKYPSRPAT